MSFWKAFFQPMRLFLGAVIFFLIFNPGILFDIIATFVSLIFSSWIIGAILVIILAVALDSD
jgi:hypothetical protein